MGMSKDEVKAFLTEETRVGRLGTAGADGAPHVVPVWFKVVGDDIHVHTQAESTKAMNLVANGRFAFAVDKDTMPYKGVSITGPAEVVGDDVVDSIALVKELAVRYVGPEGGPAFGEYIAAIPGVHVTLVLHIENWESWDYSS